MLIKEGKVIAIQNVSQHIINTFTILNECDKDSHYALTLQFFNSSYEVKHSISV